MMGNEVQTITIDSQTVGVNLNPKSKRFLQTIGVGVDLKFKMGVLVCLWHSLYKLEITL